MLMQKKNLNALQQNKHLAEFFFFLLQAKNFSVFTNAKEIEHYNEFEKTNRIQNDVV